MSWKSISGNQTVSRANLQNAIDTGVFIQRNGVPGTETNRQITKANTQDYIYIWDLYPPFAAKTSNELPVKSNLAVQSMQFFGTNDDAYKGYIFVGNNDRSWVYQIFTFGSTGQIMGIASSTNGQYILCGKFFANGSQNGGSAIISYNYGETFSSLTSIIGSGDSVSGVAVSNDGSNMIMTRQKGNTGGSLLTKIFASGDYGGTWSTAYTSTIEYVMNGAAINGAGNRWVALGCDNIYGINSYYIFKSNFYTAPSVIELHYGTAKAEQGACIAMSKSGQYIIASPPIPTDIYHTFLSIYFLSTDYGDTWTTINAPSTRYQIIQFTGCTVSAAGDYMSVSCEYQTGSGGSAAGGYIFTSSDFGATWIIANTYNGTTLSFVTTDRSGQFQYASVNGSLQYSQTYGQIPWNSLPLPAGGLNAISVTPTTGTTPYIYALLNNVYGTYTPKYTKTTGQSGAQYNNVGGLTAGTYNYIAASGNSNNGKYVATIQDNGTTSILWISSDYGQTWANRFGTSGEMLKVCAISDNGTYILAVTYNSANNTAYIYRSADSGATFQYIYVSQTGIPRSCDMSGDGIYSTLIIYDSASGLTHIMSSSTYSATFSTVNYSGVGTDICMSNAGKYRIISINNIGPVFFYNRIVYSSDYGANFSSTSLYIEASSPYKWDYVACDNSGQVFIAALNQSGQGIIYFTTDAGVTNGYFVPENAELVPQVIGGVNVSNDGTYWSFVTTDGYSYVSTNAGVTWSPTNLGYTYTFKQLSK